ncbi:DUF4352 domain-containing protein [Anaerobacillus alkalilacustris]|uniref:DUF4352 domain-containing protein n=1 Tax=Anaerobacillus alkalilacustris TaxID=393763 RepID=UPI0014711B3C|nr:DUF4352 domain-containing protein [Anaerobacillus alkalilacustris]
MLFFVISASLPMDVYATITTKTTEEESSARIHKIGETANVGGLDVTVLSYTVAEDYGEGLRLILHLSIFNHSEEKIDVLTNNMKLIDQQGKLQPRIIVEGEKAIPTITIKPAEMYDEKIIFEINDLDMYNFSVRNPFYTGEAHWTIELND